MPVPSVSGTVEPTENRIVQRDANSIMYSRSIELGQLNISSPTIKCRNNTTESGTGNNLTFSGS